MTRHNHINQNPVYSHSYFFLQFILQHPTLPLLRSIATKTVKPVATATDVALKSKTQKRREEISSEKEESVITLLKKYDFTDTQIAILEKKSPQILRFKVESTLEPKLKFLNENGFVGSLLTDVIVKNPFILRRSLVDHLIPNYEYLRELMKIDQAASVVVVMKATWLLTSDLRKNLQPNIEFLLGEGIPMTSILKLLTSYPRSLLRPVGWIRYGVATVKEYGVEPSENVFIHALRAVLSMSESNWKKKVGILKSLGWSDTDIASTVARQPLILPLSEDKLRSTFEFFVKTMDLKPEDVINYPKLCTYSLDKRIIPRCKVVMALKEKNLLKGMNMPTFIGMTENEFSRKFILKHPAHSSSLWNLYRGAVPV
ncbi:transcription termination factor MTERF8, chloroplastic-like isoform X1 [Silene latifolia]|uniref:transcription termination factor MTERF8, chloroplastic-like isoform X1 n=1 Tax=Silene latifolia TaxID=37657 RepID=UPI003D77B9BB